MQCPDCATTLPDEDVFCEGCGRRLHDPSSVPACSCGSTALETDEEGFCLRCGRRLRRPDSDHMEQALSPAFAAVSDRGLRHDRNEDRFSIASAAERHAIVVCDGVSSSHHSETASSFVSEAVLAELWNSAASLNVSDPAAAMRKAIAAGVMNLATQVRDAQEDNPASTTVVAALVEGGRATIGWVGDSRAYWIDAIGARQLTQDHSWTNEVVAAGQMTFEQAERSPQAHAITRWIGADAGSAALADAVSFNLPGPGTLLLCTDGLWNYASNLTQMATLVAAAQAAEPDALAAARQLVSFANSEGGLDNITVALLRLEPSPKSEEL